MRGICTPGSAWGDEIKWPCLLGEASARKRLRPQGSARATVIKTRLYQPFRSLGERVAQEMGARRGGVRVIPCCSSLLRTQIQSRPCTLHVGADRSIDGGGSDFKQTSTNHYLGVTDAMKLPPGSCGNSSKGWVAEPITLRVPSAAIDAPTILGPLFK